MKIKELLLRYNLKTRQSIYNWCNAVGITLAKDSNGHAYATEEQIELLDQLESHVKEGGKLSTFTPVANVEIDTSADTALDNQIDNQREPVYSSIDTQLLAEMVQALQALAEGTNMSASKLQPADPLWYMNILERAIAQEWELTTSQVQELIGVKPRCRKGEKSYKRGSFFFVKSGLIGNQTAWKVFKESARDL